MTNCTVLSTQIVTDSAEAIQHSEIVTSKVTLVSALEELDRIIKICDRPGEFLCDAEKLHPALISARIRRSGDGISVTRP